MELSKRELQVAKMIAEGMKPAEMARSLNLSEKTISTYRARVLDKIGATSNVGILRYCLENHILPPVNGPDYRGLLQRAYYTICELRKTLNSEDEEERLYFDASSTLVLELQKALNHETAVSSDG